MVGRLGIVLAALASVAIGQATTRESAGFKKEKELTLPGPPSCDYLFVDPAAKRLYLAHGTAIDVIDLAKVEKSGEVPGVTGAHGATVVPALKRGFATAGRADRLIVFDLDTLKTTKEIETGKNPDAVLFVTGSNEVWTMNGRGQSVTCVDAATLEVKNTIALGGKPEFAAESREKGRVFINLEDKNAIAVVDAKEHKVLATWALAPCVAPTGLAFDAEHGVLFAGCDKKLAILDATSGKLLASPDIGDGCDAVAFDPASKLVFASCADGTTTVVHVDGPASFSTTGKLTTARGAKTCALDAQTHKLYLAVRPGRNEKADVKLLVFAPAEAK
jgi:DNA-binding beta-propeller fold protein YncE